METYVLPDYALVQGPGLPYTPNESEHDSFGETIPLPICIESKGPHEDTDSSQPSIRSLPSIHVGGPDQILERLYLTDRDDGQSEDVIRKLGVTHVLNVHTSCRFPSDLCGYEYLHVPMSDFGDDDLEVALPKLMPFVVCGLAVGKVLVHCQMGINRSATVTICYLMMHQHFTLRRAYLHTQSIRPMISPHELYFDQMQLLEKKLFGNMTLAREDIGPSLQQMLRDIREQAAQERERERREAEPVD